MRLTGFQCDRCGKIVKDLDCCKLTEAEVSEELLAGYEQLGELELCDDCYEEWQTTLRDFAEKFLEDCLL